MSCDCNPKVVFTKIYHDIVRMRNPSCGCSYRGRYLKLDLVGKKYFKWTVLEEARYRSRSGVRLQCSCPMKSRVIASELQLVRKAFPKDCGCTKLRKSLVGKTFFNLTCVDLSEKKGHARFQCSCGSPVIDHSLSKVKSGHKKSCGCLVCPKENPSWAVYRNLKAGTARRRKGIEFSIPYEWYRALAETNPPCHYCGRELNWQPWGKGRQTGGNLDRKDSSKGYTEENAVPCCKECNSCKMELPYDEALVMLRSLRDYRLNKLGTSTRKI